MKEYKILSCIVTIVLITFSCKSSFIIGTYQDKNNSHKCKFVFRSDSTFDYYYIVAGDADMHSSGKWKIKNGNAIELNSTVQNSTLPIGISILPTKGKHYGYNVDMNILDNNKRNYRAMPFCDSFHIPHTLFFADRGSYEFTTWNPIDTLYFKVVKDPLVLERLGPSRVYNELVTEKKVLHLNCGDSVQVIINVVDSLFSYKIFKRTTIQLGKHKLIYIDEDNHKYILNPL
jgi:hypothetical protein